MDGFFQHNFLQYSLGEHPIIFLNVRLKQYTLGNPSISAITPTGFSDSRIHCMAKEKLFSSTYSSTVNPVSYFSKSFQYSGDF